MWITINSTKEFEERIRVKREDVEMILDSLTVKAIRVASVESIESVCPLCKKYSEGLDYKQGCVGCPLFYNVHEVFLGNRVGEYVSACVHVEGSFIWNTTRARDDILLSNKVFNECALHGEWDLINKHLEAVSTLNSARRRLRRALKSPNRHRKYN